MNKKIHESILTAQIRTLLQRMFDRSPINDSLLDKAVEFFEGQGSVQEIHDQFAQKQVETETKLENSNTKKQASNEKVLANIETDKEKFAEQLALEKQTRLAHFHRICDEILELTEGDTFQETNRKSAQVLGTIQLLSPTQGRNVAVVNELHKPLYRAILTLRLFDRLLMDNHVEDTYISGFLGEYQAEQYQQLKELDETLFEAFKIDVKRAVLCASLLQDIGNYHPDAQVILKGKENNLDPFRTLEIEERKKLLQINYRETVRYLVEGLGVARYQGNSKEEREKFNKIEKSKLIFIRSLLKKSIAPKESIGNILKVPQIYASIVLSTKSSYNYKLIPRVFHALEQNAERGNCSARVVAALYKITGMFPQGYGVTNLPLDAHGHSLQRYEYAIVNQLYPENPEEPCCRIATRQLSFISYGSDLVVKKSENLYFKASAKRLARMSKERLLEILEKLVSNYTERAELDLIPRCWHPKDFFTLKDNQKLWNKVS